MVRRHGSKFTLTIAIAMAPMVFACGTVSAQSQAYAPAAPSSSLVPETPLKQKFLDALPPQISDQLDIDGWLWLGFLHADGQGKKNFYDAELSLDISKTFGHNISTTFEGNFIDANGEKRAELEQGFVSVLLNENAGSILTIGKFNANFGIEPRDFWDRTTGTTSPLFGAQPQDLVGFMFTQPIGDTGIKLRPFMSLDFQGQFYADQPPSGGIVMEYTTPGRQWHFQVTNWVGPGLNPFYGQPIREPYDGGSYGDGPGVGGLISNWQGPHLDAARMGTLYFVNANLTWRPRPDLTLAGEYLLGSTGTQGERWGWGGASGIINYDFTDHWRAFGRASYLDDNDWITTGFFQRVYEFSAGLSYKISEKVELRTEYRHDNSTAFGNVDSISVHLTAGF